MITGHTDEMRKAVAAGDWAAALRLWDAYAVSLRDEIDRGACTPALMFDAREFLDWAQRVALCARAQTLQRLDAIHAARQYGLQPDQPGPSMRASL